MRITQGTFSFLPDLTDDQITRQIAYCQRNGWAVNIEFTDDPHPRNVRLLLDGHAPKHMEKSPVAGSNGAWVRHGAKDQKNL